MAEAATQGGDKPGLGPILQWVGGGLTGGAAAGVGLMLFEGTSELGARALVYGVGVAMLLLLGWRGLGALFAGVGLAGWIWGMPPAQALLLAVLVSGESLFGAWLTRTWCGGVRFLDTLQDFGRFVLAVGLGLPTLWLGAEFLLTEPFMGRFNLHWLQRGLAYLLSLLTLTPTLVLLMIQPPQRWNWAKGRELGILMLGLLFTAGYAFAGAPELDAARILIAFIPTPLLVTAALSFSPRETALLTTGLAGMVLPAAHWNLGLFGYLPSSLGLLAAESYLASSGLLALVTSIVVEQRRRVRHELERTNRELERRVEERTRQLETDNAARRATEIALRHSEIRSRDQLAELDQIYRHTPVGLCVLDRLLRFERVNPYLARLNRLPADAHRGQLLGAVAPALAAAIGEPVQRVLSTGAPILDFEFSLAAEAEAPRRWLASFHPRRSAAGEVTGVFAAFTDVTALRRAEEALRQSELQRERAVAFARTMVVHVGLDGRFLRVPAALCELLGYSAHELLQKSFQDLTHPEDRAEGERRFQALLRGEVPSIEYEKRYLTRAGQVVWVHLDSIVVRDDAGQPLHLITYVRDISRQKSAELALQAAHAELEQRVAERTAELRRANEELRREIAQRRRAEVGHLQALRRLVDLQETERASIARELHDQLGQELNALHLALGLLRDHLHDPAALERELRRLRERTSLLIQAMHHMAWDLRPPALDDFGLEVALRRYCTEFAQRTGLTVQFQAHNMEVERLSPRAETALYRVAQEALANVYFHARATTVNLLLQRRGDLVSLIVEDDGQGFNVEALRAQNDIRLYLGLLGMEERMLLVGGSLTIESRPGEGTTVLATLPFAPQPSPDQPGQPTFAETRA